MAGILCIRSQRTAEERTDTEDSSLQQAGLVCSLGCMGCTETAEVCIDSAEVGILPAEVYNLGIHHPGCKVCSQSLGCCKGCCCLAAGVGNLVLAVLVAELVVEQEAAQEAELVVELVVELEAAQEAELVVELVVELAAQWLADQWQGQRRPEAC